MPVGYEKHGYVSVTIADAHPDNISQCQKLDSDTCKVWDSEWWVLVSRAMMSISRTGENVDFVIQVHIFFLKD